MADSGAADTVRIAGGQTVKDKRGMEDEFQAHLARGAANQASRKKRDLSSSVRHSVSNTRVKRDGHMEKECCCGDECNLRGTKKEFPSEGCPALYEDEGG